MCQSMDVKNRLIGNKKNEMNAWSVKNVKNDWTNSIYIFKVSFILQIILNQKK